MAVPVHLDRIRRNQQHPRPAADVTKPGGSIIELFWDRVERWPERPALRHDLGAGWEAITWRAYGQAVEELAAGLMSLGVARGDRVAIIAANQARWHMADMAIMSAAASTVPAYPTSAAGQIGYVLRHSGSRVCFAGDRDQLAKVLLRRHELPKLEQVIVFGEVPPGLDDDFVVSFDEVRMRGRDRLHAEPGAVRDRRFGVDPNAIATIVYTSGTTGEPKGAMLSFANLAATLESVTAVVDIGPDDRFLSFLPLSHIAERVTSHFGQIAAGGETWFARSLDTVPEDLRSCRPTIFFAVPRVWEKLRAAISEEIESSPRPVRAMAKLYLRAAARHIEARRIGRRERLLGDVPEYRLADALVGRAIRRRAGLDRARLLVSGAAPVHPDLLWWFMGIGLPIAEVYGQTEDCGPTTLNPPDHIRVGSVGLPLPGIEVRIAVDGEILVRGPNVCAGYLDDPVHTAELIDDRGWMHSGDLGRIDRDGYVYVTGREKDLIITSSGKNIAPQELESRLRAEPLISQAVVIGDGRSHLTALIALDPDSLPRWAAARGLAADLPALATDPALEEELATAIDAINRERSPIEQIKTWRVLPRELTVTSGELTPTLKVRRDVVASRFADLIEEMYAPAGNGRARGSRPPMRSQLSVDP